MTKLNALKNCVWLEYFVSIHSDGEIRQEAKNKLTELQKYISKLPDDELENKPLTLREVTERRGKPLWYQPITNGEDTPFDNEPIWFICNPDKLPEPFYLYGKTWAAYLREPVSK